MPAPGTKCPAFRSARARCHGRHRPHHHSHRPGPAAERCRAGPALADDVRSALERGEFRGKRNEIYVARTPAQGWRARAWCSWAAAIAAKWRPSGLPPHGGPRRKWRGHQRRAALRGPTLEPGALAAGAHRNHRRRPRLANFDNGVHKSRNDQQFFIREAVVLTGERGRGGASTGSRSARRSTPRAC